MIVLWILLVTVHENSWTAGFRDSVGLIDLVLEAKQNARMRAVDWSQRPTNFGWSWAGPLNVVFGSTALVCGVSELIYRGVSMATVKVDLYPCSPPSPLGTPQSAYPILCRHRRLPRYVHGCQGSYSKNIQEPFFQPSTVDLSLTQQNILIAGQTTTAPSTTKMCLQNKRQFVHCHKSQRFTSWMPTSR